MIIDSHSHLAFPVYDDDRKDVIARMKEQGVGSIDIGTTLETSRTAVELARRYDNIWAAVGVHPSHASQNRFHDKNELKDAPKGAELFNKEEFKKLLDNPRVVAVGECGLDYFHKPYDKEAQEKVFRQQIEFSIEARKPLVLHCREAHQDAINILNEYKDKLLERAGTVHFFTGTAQEAQKYIDMGFYVGLDGPITFVSDYDNLIKELPLGKILIETDCPYATPAPHRGKRNEPVYVVEVAKKVAEVKNIDLDEVLSQTTRNAIDLFLLSKVLKQ